MKISFVNFSIIFFLLFLLLPGIMKGQVRTEDEKELIKTIEQFLFIAGNYNLDAMAEIALTDLGSAGTNSPNRFEQPGHRRVAEQQVEKTETDNQQYDVGPFGHVRNAR